MKSNLALIKCVFARSAFSEERVFTLRTADGEDYIGVAPIHYCYTTNGRKLPRSKPGSATTVTGKLAARLMSNGGKQAEVAIPDGERITVPISDVSPRNHLGRSHE